MENTTYSGKRIMLNTFYLYVRQMVTLGVSLYTSRVTLDCLGVEDFGIYNVIAGIVVLLSLLNGSMVSATQRFLTFEIGNSDAVRVNNTFCMGMNIHIAICILVLILGETVGLWYVCNEMIVPAERYEASLWVYQVSLLTIIFNIIRSPYTASVVAYEKMSFFAMVSIFEVVLKLLAVMLMVYIAYDKLIQYSLWLLLIAFLTTALTIGYCNRSFDTCKLYRFFDKTYFVQLTSFLGWSMFGVFATMGTQQVGNIIINRFASLVFNAAYGTANQVSAAISSFVTNFQTAFTPQIVKLYAQNEKELMFKLMFRSSLLSFYLLYVLVIPLLFTINYVLSLWLKEVPLQTDMFCIFILLSCFIDALQAPFWIAISASGKIKAYQLWQSTLFFCNIPLAYIVLKYGFSAYSVVVVRFGIGFLCAICRTIHVKITIKVPVIKYLREVILKVICVTLLTLPLIIFFSMNYEVSNLLRFIIFYTLSALYIIIVVSLVGFNKDDRNFAIKLIRAKIKI